MKRILTILLILFFAFGGNAQDFKKEELASARKIRRAELNDPMRPNWHLTIAEGKAMPFDPNGAIFKDGVYHLWYIYQDEGKCNWQHLTSIDLFHWRWMANDLKPNPGDPEHDIFSGNAFLANDGKVVLAYHGLGTDGNCVAVSADNDLTEWTKPKTNPIAKPGWDPHMWVDGSTYYQISGGIPGAKHPNPPVLYVGDAYDKPMKKIGEFMTHDMPDVNDFEDVSCPDFFKLGNKWVLLCISHSRGARYYIGTWDGKKFNPESHHRMNWPGGTMFAPETLLDSQGRRIMWAWVLDRKSGPSSGMMSMPRVLTLSKDQLSLVIEPPKEVEQLRYVEKEEKAVQLAAGQTVRLDHIAGNSLELNLTIRAGEAKRFGVNVFCSNDGREKTPIVIDRTKNILQIDMRNSSLNKPVYNEFAMAFASPDPKHNPIVETQDAPLTIKDGEKVQVRIFLDKSMLEVFVNGRQCLTQVIYPTQKDAIGIELFADDAPIKVENIKAWKLFPAMQW